MHGKLLELHVDGHSKDQAERANTHASHEQRSTIHAACKRDGSEVGELQVRFISERWRGNDDCEQGADDGHRVRE